MSTGALKELKVLKEVKVLEALNVLLTNDNLSKFGGLRHDMMSAHYSEPGRFDGQST